MKTGRKEDQKKKTADNLKLKKMRERRRKKQKGDGAERTTKKIGRQEDENREKTGDNLKVRYMWVCGWVWV